MMSREVGEHAYFRLHGRNRQAWFDKQAGRDEIGNYCYSKTELGEIVQRAKEIAKTKKSLTIVANNHYHGQEVANALYIKALISGKKVKVPPSLARRYPELMEIAEPSMPDSLFD